MQNMQAKNWTNVMLELMAKQIAWPALSRKKNEAGRLNVLTGTDVETVEGLRSHH